MIRNSVPTLLNIPYGKKYIIQQMKSLLSIKPIPTIKQKKQHSQSKEEKELEKYVKEFLRETL
tara:strand:- start:175 stop:363 length:189 start_codon:yes stop_codon:yes gene_type:complete